MTQSEGDLAVTELNFVRLYHIPPQPPPMATTGAIGWLRANLLSTPFNIALTVVVALLLIWAVPALVKFLIVDAVWTGSDRDACLESVQHREIGACWPFVWERLPYFIYGSYPIPERWRVDVFFAMLAIGVVWLLWLNAPRRDLGALYFFVVLPIGSYVLLHGFEAIGLPVVDTVLWGGVLVTIVLSAVGIVVSLPIGIVLALGRRSRMPAVRLLSTVFIEFVRGVPLITVLFMSSVMLPVFLPPGANFDKLLRALIGVALFTSAYMAETVRGGLQAIPRGQYEGAKALGLPYWRMMQMIILPQALKIVIPGIVNSFISLFKDTSLVLIIGLFDLLGIVQLNFTDANWATYKTPATGYVFAAFVFWLFCFGMSRYSIYTERRLDTGYRR